MAREKTLVKSNINMILTEKYLMTLSLSYPPISTGLVIFCKINYQFLFIFLIILELFLNRKQFIKFDNN